MVTDLKKRKLVDPGNQRKEIFLNAGSYLPVDKA
jgi:hypothetical protein